MNINLMLRITGYENIFNYRMKYYCVEITLMCVRVWDILLLLNVIFINNKCIYKIYILLIHNYIVSSKSAAY